MGLSDLLKFRRRAPKEFDEGCIDLGRRLKHLRDEVPDFAVVLGMIRSRMNHCQEMVINSMGSLQDRDASTAIAYYLYRYQALKELLDELDTKIERGESELRAKLEARDG